MSIQRTVRQRIWMTMENINHTIWVQRDPTSSWSNETDLLAELPRKIKAEYGIKELMAFPENGEGPAIAANLEGFMLRGNYPPYFFDALELFYEDMENDLKNNFQKSINQIMEENELTWGMAEGKIFPVDSQYIEEAILRKSHELLKEVKFEGVLLEFEKARTDIANGDYQGAIQNANLAVESIIKGILGIERAKPGELFRQLVDSKIIPQYYSGFLKAFEENILRCVNIMRNEELGAGHGQGTQVNAVPEELAELAVHLSAVIIHYLIKRHLTKEDKSVIPDDEVEIPF